MILRKGKNKELHFSENWNNKLESKAYTTFRLYQKHKYFAGARFRVYLDHRHIHNATVIEVMTMYLNEVTPRITYLDAGCDYIEFKAIIRRLYVHVDGIDERLFCLILLKREGRAA